MKARLKHYGNKQMTQHKNIRYLIFHTPRTGSNLLVDLLAHTGVAGINDVYRGGLFVGYGEQIENTWPHKFNEYFKSVESENGVQGCKVGFDYLQTLDQYLKFGQVDILMSGFTHFLWIRRRDKIAQAVSWFIARRTGKWQSNDKPVKSHKPEYDYDRLCWFLTRIYAQESPI